MNYIQTYERLEPIINAIDKSVICQSVVDNSDGTYTFACNYTNYLTDGYDVTIGLVTYKIVDFVCNQSITVSGASLPTVLTFDLYPLIYKHGTIKKVASELSDKISYKDKLPLIFLHEILEEEKHFDSLDSIDNDVDIRIYFLTDCNFPDWTQLDGDTKGVQPMRNLCREFIKALSKSQYIGLMTGTGTIKNYNVFGNYNDNGVIKNILNEFLTGVQLRVTIPFLKYCDCSTSTSDGRPAPGYVYDSEGNILAILYSNETYTVEAGGGEVEIIDQNDDVIDTVEAPGQYQVTVFSGVRDTITSNVTTILDNII